MSAPTWSVNRPAAKAVALAAHSPVEGRELLEMIGLIAPGGREILPDDTRNYDAEVAGPETGSTIGWRAVAPEPPAPADLIPAGLRGTQGAA